MSKMLEKMTGKKPEIRPKRMIQALQRRADFLSERIAQGGEKPLSYDLEERMALKWAINLLSPLLKIRQEGP